MTALPDAGSPAPDRGAPDDGVLLLIDTSVLFYRAYTAFRPDRPRPRDWVVRGFFDQLAVLVSRFEPDALLCALDVDWRPAWRVDLLPAYKAERAAAAAVHSPVAVDASGASGNGAPPDLAAQAVRIEQGLTHLGIGAFGQVGFEAEDIIASAAAAWSGPVLLATSDRDLMQLVDDRVHVIDVSPGVRRAVRVDAAEVARRYGVPPAGYAGMAVLRGDKSDGLPGVTGVGDATAARLVRDFGSLPAVLTAAAAHDPRLTPRLADRIRAEAAYLAAAQEVTRLRTDAPVPRPQPCPAAPKAWRQSVLDRLRASDAAAD